MMFCLPYLICVCWYENCNYGAWFQNIYDQACHILYFPAFYFHFSPYWIQSYKETFSSFKHMGLWEYCFDQFRFPNYQFDKPFDGCHHIFSQEYYVLREWLLPGWLMVVQAFVTLSLLLSFLGQALIAMILVRLPLRFVLRYEWLLSGIACVCSAITSKYNFI